MIERYYSVRELAELSGICKNQIYRAIERGDLRAVMPNGNMRGLKVSESAFEGWLKSIEVGA